MTELNRRQRRSEALAGLHLGRGRRAGHDHRQEHRHLDELLRTERRGPAALRRVHVRFGRFLPLEFSASLQAGEAEGLAGQPKTDDGLPKTDEGQWKRTAAAMRGERTPIWRPTRLRPIVPPRCSSSLILHFWSLFPLPGQRCDLVWDRHFAALCGRAGGVDLGPAISCAKCRQQRPGGREPGTAGHD